MYRLMKVETKFDTEVAQGTRKEITDLFAGRKGYYIQVWSKGVWYYLGGNI